ncbi:MAG: hypothetical protein KA247_05175 [Bacteroidetes bacterium]|nr:hypothetical protein [Bacteroidota bacterium]
MNKSIQTVIVLCALIIGVTAAGCDDSSSTPTTGKTGTGLFKTEGTFSFTSNRGNFTATGVYDTLMTNPSASGAFTYTEDGKTVVMVFAYNIVSQTNIQMVFSGVADASGTVTAGSYPFNVETGSKVGIFGYFPNLADNSAASAFYVLTGGAMNVSSVSTGAVAGTFAGTGVNVEDTLQTITITNGTYNTPVVERYYETPGTIEALAVEKIKAAVRKELMHLQK